MNHLESLYVVLPYATFLVNYKDGKVCKPAAPIAMWMLNKDISFIKQWITKKNGTYEYLKYCACEDRFQKGMLASMMRGMTCSDCGKPVKQV